MSQLTNKEQAVLSYVFIGELNKAKEVMLSLPYQSYCRVKNVLNSLGYDNDLKLTVA